MYVLCETHFTLEKGRRVNLRIKGAILTIPASDGKKSEGVLYLHEMSTW